MNHRSLAIEQGGNRANAFAHLEVQAGALGALVWPQRVPAAHVLAPFLGVRHPGHEGP